MEGRMTVDDIKTKFGDEAFCLAVMMKPLSMIEIKHAGSKYQIMRDLIIWDYSVRKVS